jgi:hypothetical protein
MGNLKNSIGEMAEKLPNRWKSGYFPPFDSESGGERSRKRQRAGALQDASR